MRGQRNEDVCEEVNGKREEGWAVKEPENQARGEQHSLCPYRVPDTFLKMKRERCSINKRMILSIHGEVQAQILMLLSNLSRDSGKR